MVTREGETVWILDEAVLEADDVGVPVWHGVLYDITERKLAEQELQRAATQQATVARLGERALKNGDPRDPDGGGGVAARPDRRGRDLLHLEAGPRRPPHPPGGRARGHRSTSSSRVSAARDSHAGAAIDSGLHVIIDDWSSEQRYSMPPALRVLGVRSSLAVPIEGKDGPFGVLDIHSTDPRRFTPQDVHFVQASANVLADAIERHAADEALRHRVLHDALTGLPNRLSFVESLSEALGAATSPARRSGSSSSTSTTSS